MKSPKKLLILGSGGREHALSWHLKLHGHDVDCTPGSDAIHEFEDVWKFKDFNELVQQCKEHKVDEVIVGPEQYLDEGVADVLQKDGIPVFGPTKDAARLESDKAYAKEFCIRHKIPTAKSETIHNIASFDEAIKSFKPPYVVKASGLAAGKGVWIGDKLSEAKAFAAKMLESHSSLVLEEFLNGEEISYFVAVDGTNHAYLGAAQDHKRLLDKDEGPNTGGMGAYCPVPALTDSLKEKIEAQVVKPSIEGLKKDGIPYRGFLFFGLMLVNNELYLLEYNCRMGDPETQVVMMHLENSLWDIIESLKTGNPIHAKHKKGVCMNVVLAAKGYPAAPEKGFQMPLVDALPKGCVLFHAGTKWDGEHWVANGGRLVSVNTIQNSLKDCQKTVYPWIESLKFLDKISYRKDIGEKAYKHISDTKE
jgi:phosphoribosylamine--glycine ligase